MHTQLQLAAEILTSNRIYAFIMDSFNQVACPLNALLLVPTRDDSNDLEVVEVIGDLPVSLRFAGIKESLDKMPPLVINQFINEEFSVYEHIIRFESSGNSLAYLLFSFEGDTANLPPIMPQFISEMSSLLTIKNDIDSLPRLKKSQSKLMYQLSFFANTINNIFEPYGIEMLVQLYMEIISEMFILPAAISLKSDGKYYRPHYAKGTSLQDYVQLVIPAEPFQQNWKLKTYPTFISQLTPEILGKECYDNLLMHGVYLLAPISCGEHNYLVLCVSCDKYHFDDADLTSLIALSNTVNHAVQFNCTKEHLILSNNALDQKVFSLTSLHHAAQIIFANNNLFSTIAVASDMLMEIFQSVTNAVVLKNWSDDNYKLVNLKSVMSIENFDFLLEPPAAIPNSRILIDYNDAEQRDEFLTLFPDFIRLEQHLQPVIIAQLSRENNYYGFISMSNRVTGQAYRQEDKELLTLLINSITIAVENALFLNQLEEVNLQLDNSLQNLYAIQDVLTIVRQADSIRSFCELLSSALLLGLGANTLSILAKDNLGLDLLYGELKITAQLTERLNVINEAGIYNLPESDSDAKALVIPIYYAQRVAGFLVIKSFQDTIIEDGDRIIILSLIAGIIGETFNRLLEQRIIAENGIYNYPRLIAYRLQQEINDLKNLGLEANILRFTHHDPETLLLTCKEWAEGLVLMPNLGILISPLSADAIIEKIAPLVDDYFFISTDREASIIEALFTNL